MAEFTFFMNTTALNETIQSIIKYYARQCVPYQEMNPPGYSGGAKPVSSACALQGSNHNHNDKSTNNNYIQFLQDFVIPIIESNSVDGRRDHWGQDIGDLDAFLIMNKHISGLVHRNSMRIFLFLVSEYAEFRVPRGVLETYHSSTVLVAHFGGEMSL